MTAKRPIRDLERELKREPANLALRLTLAAAYREAARASDAVELYRSVARAYLEQGRVGQAAAVCKSALEITPTDSELYGMLHHLERTGAATMPPPMGTPVGSAPAMPVSLTTTLMGNAPPPPHTPAPQMIDGPPSRPARVLPADVALREVGSVAPAAVKHVPPPPPVAVPAPASPPPRSLVRGATPTGRNSTLDGDTPLPDPLALHDSTGRDSLVEMVELLTSPSPSPAAPPPPLPPPAPPRPAAPPPSPVPMRPKLGAIPGSRPVAAPDDDSETIVPLTQVRNPGNRAPVPPTDPPTLVARSAPSTEPPLPVGPRGAPTTPPPMGRAHAGSPTSRSAPSTEPPPASPRGAPTGPPPMGARSAATPPAGTPRAAPPGPPPGAPRPGGATRPPPPTRPPAGGGGLPRLTATSPPPPRSAPPPALIDDAPTDLGALPSSSDYSAEMVTRKRPKLSARDLSLLDLDPLSADSADTGVDEALTNPGPRGPAVAPPPEPSPRAPSESTATARHPAVLVEDDDEHEVEDVTGDTGDTGRNPALVFDDEPTHPPPAGAGADGTLRGASEAAHDQLHRREPDPDEHEHTGDHTSTRPSTEESSTELSSSNLMQSFDAALSALGPDGSVLEGPLGVFSMLPPEAAQELSRRAVVKQFDAGEVIIQEGEMGDACFVIAHGEVVVQRRSDDEIGGMVELARLSDGSLFGEFALLADRRRHATVVATTEVEVFEIPRLLLRELAAVFPEVGPALERFYRERLLANLLRTTPLFSLVVEEQRPALLARFHPLHADSGQAIVRQGERAGGLYLIVLGAVEVVRRVGERRAVVLATLGEGAYFGEMSLLSGEMASASVVAAGPCELAVLPPRDFYDLVAHNPELWITMRTVAEARRLTNAQILAGHTGIV